MKTLLELFAKYEWLEERIGRGLPIPISKERQQVYARRLRRRRSSHIAELPPYRQELESMCFAAVCLGTLVDDMLRLVEIRITSIWNWGHKIVADRLIPARVRKKSEILAELRRLVGDQTISDEAFRVKANSLLLTDQPNTRRSRAADVREVLSRNARRIRPILQLLTKLNLCGDGVGGNGLSWLDGVYHDGIDTFFVANAPTWARRWKTLVGDSDTATSAWKTSFDAQHRSSRSLLSHNRCLDTSRTLHIESTCCEAHLLRPWAPSTSSRGKHSSKKA